MSVEPYYNMYTKMSVSVDIIFTTVLTYEQNRLQHLFVYYSNTLSVDVPMYIDRVRQVIVTKNTHVI